MSGAAALVFEALFFRLCGLVVGNGVEAVAIVLSSFMLGMALGNGFAARMGDRVAQPFRVYALLELAIAGSGLLLVLGLPVLPSLLATVLRPFAEVPLLLNAIRGLTVFALVMVPSTAMGATLPILVRALSARDPNFGRVLGRLYGWNTIGAVAGVLATEGWLLGVFGVRGSGMLAALLDVTAALAVMGLARGVARLPAAAPETVTKASALPGARLVIASAFGCGALLLALEVVWFRLFLLFRDAFGWNLAVMLAIVLAGIAIGGFASSLWFRWRPDAQRHAPALALLAGALVAFSYSELGGLLADGVPRRIEWLYFVLTFPVAFVSGMLFPMLGRALQARGVGSSRATGLTTLANTVGSATGSFVAGYLLLPRIGVEASFFMLALGYGGVAALLLIARSGAPATGEVPARRWPLVATAVVWTLLLFDFGFGTFEQRVLAPPGSVTARLMNQGYERAALRDGLTGTIQYLHKDVHGEPHEWMLVTDGHAMAGVSLSARRYMKMYVYWPAAVHPQLRDALLISYGAANTARALTEQESIEHIDVVDISRDILELSGIRFPEGRDPLSDPRVEAHIEDGRFFLQTTQRRYDLITAEPPPPRVSGVENLYSQEYFELIRDRLRDGGIATYWLPVYQFYESEAASVMKAFCEAFPNCSLWIGAGLEWMMVGLKEPYASVDLESYTRGWHDPLTRKRLAAIGLHQPHQLASLYLADGERLREWIGDALPLDDDHPHRIAPFADAGLAAARASYHAFMESPDAAAAFRASETMRRLFPGSVHEHALAWMSGQRLVELIHDAGPGAVVRLLHHMLGEDTFRPYLPWLLGMDSVARDILVGVDEQAALRGELPADVATRLAGAALERGDLVQAEALLEAAIRGGEGARSIAAHVRLYLQLRLGERDAAYEQLAQMAAASRNDPNSLQMLRLLWHDLRSWFDLDLGFRGAVGRGRELRRGRPG